MKKKQSVLLGWAGGIGAALIGGGWQVATRQSTTSTIAPQDLILLRYAIPALLLLPLTISVGLFPCGVSMRILVAMIAGGGLPFGLLAMSGTQYAPASHMGVLMAGMMPVFTAALGWLFWRERLDKLRIIGLVLMVVAASALAIKSIGAIVSSTVLGDAMFVCAALLWAGFTVAFRRAGLTAWQGAALVNVWSLLLLLPWIALRGGTALSHAPIQDLLYQALWQGLIAGVLGLWTYALAINCLGASRAAAFGALVPVISACGGWWWLGDPLSRLDVIAVAFASGGVLLASGAIASSMPERPNSTT